jgi:alpha/beta superfamily hydrolase
MPGLPLERSVPIACAGLARALDGVFLGAPEGSAADGAVIAPPHPLYGGSMQSPVVNELAYALQKAGIASLRFDWRGIGASGGTPSGRAQDADEDYAAALEHLEETLNGELLACGYSFGAAAALRAAVGNPRVTRMLLVSPPPQLLDAAVLARFIGRALIVTGELDAIAPPDALGVLAARARRGHFAVLPGCDHFFGAGLAELGREVSGWLAGNSR